MRGGEPPAPTRASDRVVFGAGLFGLFDRHDAALDLRFEYRWGFKLWVLQPWAGIEVTSDRTLFGIVGLLADFDMGSRWVCTPSVGVGPYSAGNGRDLGHPIEFRTQLEFARRFARDSRFAIALSHISNAGLGDTNPGNEALTVYYSIPLGRESGDRTKESPP